jgi:hypothetical protein
VDPGTSDDRPAAVAGASGAEGSVARGPGSGPKQGNRTGTGRIGPDGKTIECFDPRGHRSGTGGSRDEGNSQGRVTDPLNARNAFEGNTMALRFRKSFKILPGVRLNLTTRGLSSTLGPRGAGIGIGPRGVYGNVGIRGTGLSARARLDGGGRR